MIAAKCLAVLLCVLSCGVGAREAAAPAASEKRVMMLADELRCLVCQNQTIADSNAPLAIDLREQIREKIGQGMSDAQIVDYMVVRYGDFVRYRPPLRLTTLLLWFGPAALLLGALAYLFIRLRARRREPTAPLTEEERARATALLTEGDPGR